MSCVTHHKNDDIFVGEIGIIGLTQGQRSGSGFDPFLLGHHICLGMPLYDPRKSDSDSKLSVISFIELFRKTNL